MDCAEHREWNYVLISVPNNWCHGHLNLQCYNDIGILDTSNAMMRCTSEVFNLISWVSVSFAVDQLFALLILRPLAALLAIISQNPVFLTTRSYYFHC